MNRIPCIAIYDVGKTNKKLLLFNEQYRPVYEESRQLPEVKDEDGFSCEDVAGLTKWVKDSFHAILQDERFSVKAVNFSAYGASFVLLDEAGEIALPLYNYLKPYPAALKKQFYAAYGGESMLARQTASPVLGSLNSGMQLYRLKHERPAEFARIQNALHLPQYLHYIITGKLCSDITSIGCHTNLWDFQNNMYHKWVAAEGIARVLAPLSQHSNVAIATETAVPAGIGMHDSSAALVPYLLSEKEPFVLLSTGTWCITLNPFNHTQLSDYELHQDCLCYLSYESRPVKASRLFAGYEHEQQVKRLAAHFDRPADHYKQVDFLPELMKKVQTTGGYVKSNEALVQQSVFATRSLDTFDEYEAAYHQLIADIIQQQKRSTGIVLKGTGVKKIFVDGGFSSNAVYMQLLANAFPSTEVYAASMPQASAVGAALAMHDRWNRTPLPQHLVEKKRYMAMPF